MDRRRGEIAYAVLARGGNLLGEGGEGALAGAHHTVGGAGTFLATEGEQVELPAGTGGRMIT